MKYFWGADRQHLLVLALLVLMLCRCSGYTAMIYWLLGSLQYIYSYKQLYKLCIKYLYLIRNNNPVYTWKVKRRRHIIKSCVIFLCLLLGFFQGHNKYRSIDKGCQRWKLTIKDQTSLKSSSGFSSHGAEKRATHGTFFIPPINTTKY